MNKWDVLVMYHWYVVGCFIWDLFEMSRRHTDGTSLLRPLETLSRCSNKMSWRRITEKSWWRSTEMSLSVSFQTYLRRHLDVQRDVVTTSLGRLVSGRVRMKHQIFMSLSWKSDASKIEARKPHLSNKQCKSIDWFLYEGNMGI